MKLSVSNLGWPAHEEEWCLTQLVNLGIEGVELAPLKSISSWNASNSEIEIKKEIYSSLGLEISSFQAITYNAKLLSLCGNSSEVSNFLKHMDLVSSLLLKFGGQFAVFGSPTLRNKECILDENVFKTFNEVGDIFSSKGVKLALETVPEYYGCYFLNNISETENFLSKIKSENIVRHFDTGCQFLSNDLVDSDYKTFLKNSEHCHISEKDLNNFSTPSGFNLNLASDIKDIYSGDWVVLEMSDKNYSRRSFIDSITNFLRLYGR